MRWVDRLLSSRWINWFMVGVWGSASIDLAIMAYGNTNLSARFTLLMGILGCAFWAGNYAAAAWAGMSASRWLDKRIDEAIDQEFDRKKRGLQAIVGEDELHEHAQRNVRYL